MKTILEANTATLSILGKTKLSDGGWRLMKYCAQLPVEEGILLLNMITKEMVLLTQQEFDNFAASDYLKEHWFVVPETLNDKAQMDKVRWVVEMTEKKTDAITSYTILPTTDCNARCFYCFEKGAKHVHMTEETAKKTAAYIQKKSKGNPVTLAWFGGEPLYNSSAIDTICSLLKENEVSFKSCITTNGYLFDAENVKKAVELWNLQRVQITLDGTEEVYNRIKAYIYTDENPYDTVMRNIGLLLEAGITVNIRLNMDLYNSENLMELVDELAGRFAGKAGLHVYANHLFDASTPSAELHNKEGWQKRADAMFRLQEKIAFYGLERQMPIEKKLKTNHCCADNDNAIIVLPTGVLGRCEHHLDDEHIGHIDHDEFDKAVIAAWKERMPEIPECADCIHYPNCIRLRKCTTSSQCFHHSREKKTQTLAKAMRSEYDAWLKKGK